MDGLALYLVKSAALMAMFLGAYHVFLKRETFFKSNRWYLLLGLVTSLLLPLVTFKKVVLVEPSLNETAPVLFSPEPYTTLTRMDAPALVHAVPPPSETPADIDWMLVVSALYVVVAVFLAIRFAFDFLALRRLLSGKACVSRSGYKFIDVPENVAPFSYFNYIVYNSSMFSHDELINVLEHEKVHSGQRHTLDVLFSRTICVLFWWNPVVWFYKKAIVQNLEFIADSEAAKKIPDIKAYQFTLLKITTHENCVSITNHFFQSLIKKRIVMLNKNQSNKWNSYKYLLIVPALAAFILYFQVKVVAQEKHSDALFFKGAQQGIEVVVDKNTTDDQLREHAENLRKSHGIKLKFSKVKRNSAGEIVSIKAEFKDGSGTKGTTTITNDRAIEPFRFYKNGTNVGFGNAGKSGWTKNMRISRNQHGNNFAFSSNDEHAAIAEPFESDEDSAANRQIVVRTIKDGKHKVIVNGKVVSEVDIDTNSGIDHMPVDVETIGSEIFINGERIFSEEDVEKWAELGLSEAEKALAEIDIEEAHQEVRRAMAEVRRNKADVMSKRHESRRESKKGELEQMRAELQEARAEMETTRAEMAEMRAELKKQKALKGKNK